MIREQCFLVERSVVDDDPSDDPESPRKQKGPETGEHA